MHDGLELISIRRKREALTISRVPNGAQRRFGVSLSCRDHVALTEAHSTAFADVSDGPIHGSFFRGRFEHGVRSR